MSDEGSILDLLPIELLKMATALLLGAMKAGGEVTIRVENHRPLFVVSDAPVGVRGMDVGEACAVWEADALRLLKQELVEVVGAGYGEVTLEVRIRKRVSWYPGRG